MLDVENHGDDGAGKLTWTTVADTVLGLGSWMGQNDYNTAEWQLVNDEMGNIGVGYIGEPLRDH